MDHDDFAGMAQGALKSTCDGVLAFDAAWRFTYVNDAAERLMNRTRTQLLGRVLWDLYPGLIESPFGAAYMHAMTDRVATHVESFYEPLEACYEVRAFPSDTGIFTFTRDITARKAGESTAHKATSVGAQAPTSQSVEAAKRLELSMEAMRSIVRLSHCIEDELGATMTSQSLRDMALLRGCVRRLRSALQSTT